MENKKSLNNSFHEIDDDSMSLIERKIINNRWRDLHAASLGGREEGICTIVSLIS